MAAFSRIVRVNGLALAPEAGGLSWRGDVQNLSENISQSVETRPRGSEGLTWVNGAFNGRLVVAYFKRGAAADLPRLLAAIEPSVGPWAMQAEMDGAVAEVLVATSSVRQLRDHVQVEVTQLDPTWRAVTPATASLTTGAADGALPLAIGGHARVRPVVTIKPTALRSATSTVKGWKYRKTITLTNNGTETIDRFGYRLALGNTATLVTAGKMQADGDDVRVWFEGADLSRTLLSMNTAATFAWIVLDGFRAGASRTYEILYGNPSAANPPVLAYPNLPAFDLGASSNVEHLYNVDPNAANHRRGLWGLPAGRPDFEIPGAWKRFLMLENGDDHNQQRRTDYTVTGSKYQHAILDAERYRKDATRLQDEGQADGIWLHLPTGITAIEASFRYLNIAENSDQLLATGKFVIMAREAAAEPWETVYERSDVQATEITTANTNYTLGVPKPRELYLGVLPRDGVEIPQNARGISRIQVKTAATFRIFPDTAAISASALSAEGLVYDCYGRLEVVPGGALPSYRVDLGGRGGSGRLAVPISNNLVIDAERRTIEEWNATSTALIARREFAGVAREVVEADGGVAALPTGDWLVGKPAPANPVPNGDFAVNTSGWSVVYEEFDVTLSRDAIAPAGLPAGSAKLAWTTNTGAVDAVAVMASATNLPCVGGAPFAVAAWRRTSNAGVVPIVALTFYDAAGAIAGGFREESWVPVANAWERRTFVQTAPATAVSVRIEPGGENRTASPGAGSVWFDEIAVGNALAFSDLDAGVILTWSHRDAYFG